VTDDLVIGGQLGNYLIESVIGRGGMSVVYRAKHSRLGTSVALKVLAPELSSDDSFRERFLREAQMAAGIDHPNVIPMHDMGLHEGSSSLYIVMRYVSDGDLKDLLIASGPLDADQAISLLMPIAQALDAAHARGLVHRDVKPANILIQRSGAGEIEHVYLTDFGIAKSVASPSGLTRAGGLIGTVEYMAPEQTEGRDVSAATDVYGLASVFYQCVTGRTPFERDLAEGAWPPGGGTLEPLSRLRPELPAALDGVMAKALSRDPSERYATCVQFLSACSYVLDARASDVGDSAGATVVDAPSRGQETVAISSAPSPSGAGSDREPPPARGGEVWPPVSEPPPPAAPPPAAPPPGRGGIGATLSKRRGYAAGALVAVVAAAVAVVLLSSSSKTAKGKLSSAPLAQVPTNHVTGSGSATVRLNGNVASVTLTTSGLDYEESLAHALHIHTGGKGLCPPASAARPHNGHLTISTTDGIKYYGPPAQSLTTSGDTSPSSILVLARYPSGGKIRYTRTITLPADVAARIRENNAVIVVHGIDYDHSGVYSGVLERSELNKTFTATTTAPALCGPLIKTTTASVGPRGHALSYTASLVVDPVGAFNCEAAEALSPAVAARRRTIAGTASRSSSSGLA
jgi:serine/threonine protein kinase